MQTIRIEALGESGGQTDKPHGDEGMEAWPGDGGGQEVDYLSRGRGDRPTTEPSQVEEAAAAPLCSVVHPGRETDRVPQDARTKRVLWRSFAEEGTMNSVSIWADGSSLGCGWYAEVDGQPVESRGVVVCDLTCNQAEYQGAIEACKWLRKQRYRGAVLRVDSRLVYEQTLGHWHTNAPGLVKLRDTLRQLVRELDVRLEWIGRDGNKAHQAAQRPLRSTQRRARVAKIAKSQGSLFDEGM